MIVAGESFSFYIGASVVINIGYWLKRPHKVPARIRYWFWEKKYPDKPWMSPGSVDYLEKVLTKNMRALEFGSGRSTLWFARYVGQLTSIEHDGAWFKEVRARMARENVTNVDYRFIAADHLPGAVVDQYDLKAPIPAYVRILETFPDNSLDFVVVDGHYRTYCARECLPKIAPGGLLLIDDVNEWQTPEGTPVPPDWPLLDNSGNGIKFTCIWQKPGGDPSKKMPRGQDAKP